MPITRDITKIQLNALINDSSRSLRNFIRFLGVNKNDVDDILQETFYVVIQKINTLDSPDNFGRWIRGIARNIILNHNRKNMLRNKNFTTLFDQDMIAEVELEYHLNDINIYIARMNECIETLPEKNKILLKKRYMNMINATDLSKSLNQSPAAIRKTLMKTRSIVADCIRKKFKDIIL